MSKTREKDSDRMVQLTLSNAVDQTQKILVEVPAGTSVADAARDAGIAPQGSFDVFTAGGEAVTRSNVDRHRDSVLYVGPQRSQEVQRNLYSSPNQEWLLQRIRLQGQRR